MGTDDGDMKARTSSTYGISHGVVRVSNDHGCFRGGSVDVGQSVRQSVSRDEKQERVL